MEHNFSSHEQHYGAMIRILELQNRILSGNGKAPERTQMRQILRSSNRFGIKLPKHGRPTRECPHAPC